MKSFAFVAMCLVVVGATPLFSQDNLQRPPEIVAVGRGETHISPTTAVVMVGIVTRAPTASQAASENAERSAAVIRALRAAGLQANDITSMGYNVGQNFEVPPELRSSPQRVPFGFLARNTVRAEVKRLDDVGKVIDASLAAGAAEVSTVQFLSPNSDNARRDAMAAAVREARQDAEIIARAAGGSLGRLLSLNSGPSMSPPFSQDYFGDMSAALRIRASSTSLMPRDLTITAQVVGRWEFVPGAR